MNMVKRCALSALVALWLDFVANRATASPTSKSPSKAPSTSPTFKNVVYMYETNVVLSSATPVSEANAACASSFEAYLP